MNETASNRMSNIAHNGRCFVSLYSDGLSTDVGNDGMAYVHHLV